MIVFVKFKKYYYNFKNREKKMEKCKKINSK